MYVCLHFWVCIFYHPNLSVSMNMKSLILLHCGHNWWKSGARDCPSFELESLFSRLRKFLFITRVSIAAILVILAWFIAKKIKFDCVECLLRVGLQLFTMCRQWWLFILGDTFITKVSRWGFTAQCGIFYIYKWTTPPLGFCSPWANTQVWGTIGSGLTPRVRK